jgi:hypothetical protein
MPRPFVRTVDPDKIIAAVKHGHQLLDSSRASGSRVTAGTSPKGDQARVSFLVEVCDPCKAVGFAYSVNGILASDFYMQHVIQKDSQRISMTAGLISTSASGGFVTGRYGYRFGTGV